MVGLKRVNIPKKKKQSFICEPLQAWEVNICSQYLQVYNPHYVAGSMINVNIL